MIYGDVKKYTATVDPGDITTKLTLDVVATVTGVGANDQCIAMDFPAALDAGVGVVGFWVSGANAITVRFMNVTAGNIDPASGSYIFYVETYPGVAGYL